MVKSYQHSLVCFSFPQHYYLSISFSPSLSRLTLSLPLYPSTSSHSLAPLELSPSRSISLSLSPSIVFPAHFNSLTHSLSLSHSSSPSPPTYLFISPSLSFFLCLYFVVFARLCLFPDPRTDFTINANPTYCNFVLKTFCGVHWGLLFACCCCYSTRNPPSRHDSHI